nr:hypothetical protein CFP56_66965 [Quercus suber]
MKPNPGWVKLNTDWAVGGALSKAGGGGVLRCNRGNWVAGFIRKLVCVTADISEHRTSFKSVTPTSPSFPVESYKKLKKHQEAASKD